MWPKHILGRDAHVLSFMLVCIGALSSRFAITAPGIPWYWPVIVEFGYAVVVVLFIIVDSRTAWFSQKSDSGLRLTKLGRLLGLLFFCLPFVVGSIPIGGQPIRPLEQMTIDSLENFAFFAVAFPRINRMTSAAASVSLVLSIVAIMIGEHAAIIPLTAANFGLSAVWLAARNWRRMTAPSHGAEHHGTESKGIPILPVFCLMATLVSVTAMSTRLAQGMQDIWGELLPSSGGSRWTNPLSLLGVGNGDWVVTGPEATSTGPVDSNYFLESNQRSIYDALTETYGESRRPEKQSLRAIVVQQEQVLSQKGQKAPHSGSAGRQFSVYRKARSRRTPVKRERADALLYVEGKTPLHLAMTVYDSFDGVDWHEPDELDKASALELHESDTSWLWLPARQQSAYFGGKSRHHLRFGRLSTKRLPLPNHLERFRLGHNGCESLQRCPNFKLWADDVLVWAHDGILRARRSIPGGIAMELSTHAVDRAELHRSCELANHGEECGACLAIPDHLRPSVDAFASRFAQLTNGWEQVDALLEHLRTHYEHHRDDMVPGTCEDPVHYFLHHSRGGPAYQFVTTAALALRSLGYPTRVVSGFYVGEEKFIARTGHTPVHLDDAHLWIEVRTDTGRWITLDPTPGYEMEWYSASLYDRLKTLGVAIMYPFKTYPVWSSAALVVAVFLFVRRLWIRERLCTLWCMWWPSRYVNRRLVLTLHTLDLRSRLCGSGRPPEATPLAWYGRVDDGDCYDFLQCLYRALYGQMESEADEITHACRAALRSTGTTKLRTRLNKS